MSRISDRWWARKGGGPRHRCARNMGASMETACGQVICRPIIAPDDAEECPRCAVAQEPEHPRYMRVGVVWHRCVGGTSVRLLQCGETTPRVARCERSTLPEGVELCPACTAAAQEERHRALDEAFARPYDHSR